MSLSITKQNGNRASFRIGRENIRYTIVVHVRNCECVWRAAGRNHLGRKFRGVRSLRPTEARTCRKGSHGEEAHPQKPSTETQSGHLAPRGSQEKNSGPDLTTNPSK
jgi:hypothetical protein